jgi:hypothetical protein
MKLWLFYCRLYDCLRPPQRTPLAVTVELCLRAQKKTSLSGWLPLLRLNISRLPALFFSPPGFNPPLRLLNFITQTPSNL